MCLPPIVSTVLDLAPKPKNGGKFNLVYLGTATFDKDEPFHAQTHAYQDLSNVNVIKLDVSEPPLIKEEEESTDTSPVPTQESIRSTLMSAQIVLVSGGNTLYAVNRWKELGIDTILQELIDSSTEVGPVLCGGSAGAICWFNSGHSDSMDPTTMRVVDLSLSNEEKQSWDYIRYVMNADRMVLLSYDSYRQSFLCVAPVWKALSTCLLSAYHITIAHKAMAFLDPKTRMRCCCATPITLASESTKMLPLWFRTAKQR